MSINKVIISGNLTRDLELRQTPGGTSVLQFGVAVNDRRKNQQTGEWEDYTNFVDCTLFGNRARSLQQYIRKGDKVAIDGKLRYSSWEKDGQKRSKLEVIVDEIELMSQSQQRQQQPQQMPQYQQQPMPQYAQQPQMPQYQQPQQAQYAQATVYDDEIPFN